jgi:hypothetical protein
VAGHVARFADSKPRMHGKATLAVRSLELVEVPVPVVDAAPAEFCFCNKSCSSSTLHSNNPPGTDKERRTQRESGPRLSDPLLGGRSRMQVARNRSKVDTPRCILHARLIVSIDGGETRII